MFEGSGLNFRVQFKISARMQRHYPALHARNRFGCATNSEIRTPCLIAPRRFAMTVALATISCERLSERTCGESGVKLVNLTRGIFEPSRSDDGILMFAERVLDVSQPSRDAASVFGESRRERFEGVAGSLGALADVVQLLVGRCRRQPVD